MILKPEISQCGKSLQLKLWCDSRWGEKNTSGASVPSGAAAFFSFLLAACNVGALVFLMMDIFMSVDRTFYVKCS